MNKCLSPIYRKIRNQVQRAKLNRVTYKGNRRLMQVTGADGAPMADLQHLESFGFTSEPLPGAMPIVLSFKGNQSHSVVLLVNDQRYRVTVGPGECAIYNHQGDKVHIKNNREIDIEANTRVNVISPELVCSGVIRCQNLTTDEIADLNTHQHDGVQSGGSNTGGPTG